MVAGAAGLIGAGVAPPAVVFISDSISEMSPAPLLFVGAEMLRASQVILEAFDRARILLQLLLAAANVAQVLGPSVALDVEIQKGGQRLFIAPCTKLRAASSPRAWRSADVDACGAGSAARAVPAPTSVAAIGAAIQQQSQNARDLGARAWFSSIGLEWVPSGGLKA